MTIFLQAIEFIVYFIFDKGTPLSLRFSPSEVTLSGFAGGEYLPLPASKGPAFPFPSAALRTSSAHPRWGPHLSRNLRSGTTVFSKNSGNSRHIKIDTHYHVTISLSRCHGSRCVSIEKKLTFSCFLCKRFYGFKRQFPISYQLHGA